MNEPLPFPPAAPKMPDIPKIQPKKKGFAAIPLAGKSIIIASTATILGAFFYSGYRQRRQESENNWERD